MSIPTGVDLERFRPDAGDRAEARRALGVPTEGPVIGVVAYLRQDKGHAVLLQALPEILESYPECSLVVVGDGPERLNLEALARHLGIEKSVRFVGLREDIPIVLAGFDIFCQPSLRNEGVPQSVLQAGAVARPVVSTEVGGIPEAVVHGETGFLVPPGDADALAERISALLADSGLRNRLGGGRSPSRFGGILRSADARSHRAGLRGRPALRSIARGDGRHRSVRTVTGHLPESRSIGERPRHARAPSNPHSRDHSEPLGPVPARFPGRGPELGLDRPGRGGGATRLGGRPGGPQAPR